ncbi:pteridine-dependent deoxygenase [uncultured Stenotrophomonas sp.]|uniref:chorismate transformation enzyme, FkbO/Hyg5 family n=1 Tax=uncultured Stenotrophomonas sp. TaxID=165438 RepID=UPI0028E8AFA7|nr:pteridine-dependent deoxygenase [uncultured Stenotrophomonas sp.]
MSNTIHSVAATQVMSPSVNPALFRAFYLPAERRADALADPQTLAVFGFSADPAPCDDPRWLRVPLAEQGPAQIEVWQGGGAVQHGVRDGVRWSSTDAVLFGAIEIDEVDGDIEAAAADAYARMSGFLSTCGFPHLLRTWNYLDAVTEGEGDQERYRRFCVGRVRGLRELDEAALPAATCIGRFDGVRRLQVYWLAAREAGLPLENPRQVSAFRYPRQYGPQSPSFSRALLPPPATGLPLLQSGTAAIVGHVSQHTGSVGEQLEETLTNLQSLVDAARLQRPALPAQLGAGSLLKVYVRRAGDMPAIAARMAELPGSPAFVVLHAEVCRAELLVEIEGLHG